MQKFVLDFDSSVSRVLKTPIESNLISEVLLSRQAGSKAIYRTLSSVS